MEKNKRHDWQVLSVQNATALGLSKLTHIRNAKDA